MLAEFDDFTLTLLRKRGIESEKDIEQFLNPSYDLHLHDPLLMKNMREASERLATAILTGEKIVVWSDYDCDGIPGGVILHDFLKKAGANFDNYIPHRHQEGYGVNVAGIEKLAAGAAKLIVTVDSGITDVDAIARARELGMDVIVTDHHLPGEKLPDAIIVDDKQEDETYPFPELCGAATAWKLVCAVLATSPEIRAKIPVGWEKWLLDMAGLATIADMVPLVGENRVIAKYGLLVLRKSPRIGLQKLCRAIRVDQSSITEDDVGFMIGPRVNAASRMGDPRDAFRLFTTEDEVEAEMLAKKLDKANRERKASAGAITRAVHERLRARTAIGSVIALGDPSWRPALLGLVANGIAEEYDRPVFLWGREGNETLKGSCRGAGVHVMNLMTATEGTFAQFGGHREAGGFTVRDDSVFFLEERLVEAHERVLRENPDAAKSVADFAADAELTPDEATSGLLSKLERLAPYGEKNPKPIFLFRDVEIGAVSRFGKGNEHVRIQIPRAREVRDPLEGIAFFAKRGLSNITDALTSGSRANIFAHIERNQFSRSPIRLRLLRIT